MNKPERPSLRYRVVDDQQPLFVAIERPDKDSPSPEGELLDISASGVRLALSSPLRFGENFRLRLESNKLGQITSVDSEVQWIRAGRSDSEWIVGCTFVTEINEQVLDALVEQAVLERRDFGRQEVTIPVSAQWERLQEREMTILRDISKGGFCLASSQSTEIGAGVRIEFVDEEEGHPLEGRVTWQSTNSDETLIGCKWNDRRGTDWFRDRMKAKTDPATSTTASLTLARRAWGLARVAIPVLAFVFGLQIGAHQSEIRQWLLLDDQPEQLVSRGADSQFTPVANSVEP